MKKIFLLMCLSALFLLNAESAPAEVSPDEVLFLAHYNHSMTPEIGRIKGMVAKGEITGGNSGYPFKNSVPRAEALNVCGNGRYMMIPAFRNIRTDQGTIQFFFKGKWKKSGYAHCVFFRLFFTDQWKAASWGGANSFVIQKSAKLQNITVFQNGNLRDAGITMPVPYSTELWHHVTVTWNQKQKIFAFYLDGKLVGTKNFAKMTLPPVSFSLGHPSGWNGQCWIDEFRILSRALTPEEVKQDYAYLTAGNEFPSPASGKEGKVTFFPVTPKAVPVGLEAQLEPVIFHAAAARSVKMTGKMSDPAWEKAVPVPPMVHRNGKPGIATLCKLVHTPTALYVGCRMTEPDMKNLVARFDQNDLGIYNDDCLEVILDPAGDPENYYHFVVNALGSIYDAKAGDKRWNGKGVLAKASRAADSWTVELKIPYRALNLTPPESGAYWGIRLCRERHHEKDNGSIAIPCCKHGGYGMRTYLGKMIFDPLSGEKASLTTKVKNLRMGFNRIPITVTGTKAGMKIRTRLFNNDNSLLKEFEIPVPASGKAEAAFPVTDDSAVRAVLALTDSNGASLSSLILPAETPYVAPGLLALDRELDRMERSCADLLAVRHPVYQGVRDSVKQMKQAIAEYQKSVTEACRKQQCVSKSETMKVLALANGFRKFQEKYRYLVWQTSPWETGNRLALPGPSEELDPELKFAQAGNERERVCLVISGLLCGRRMDLRVVPRPSNPKGKPFVSRENFEVYTEPFVFHNGEVITAPLVKVPGNIITVTPGEAVRVHIVFNSRGIPAGNYRAELALKGLHDAAIPERVLPMSMKVWNFTLPETHEWPMDCFFWGPNQLAYHESDMLRLAYSRHINYGWTQSVQYVRGLERYSERCALPKGKKFKEELVETANQEFFETARKLKMKFVFGWGTCDSIEWHQRMTARLEKMGFTKQDFIYKSMIKDEFMKKHISTNAALRAEILKLNPGWNFQAVYLSTPPPAGATLEDIEKAKLTDFFKTWTVISYLLRDPERGQKTIDFFRKHKVRLWGYKCNTSMQKQPVLEYYRFFPWFGFRKKLDGVAFWTCLSSVGPDGFDSRESKIDGACWLDDTGKPVPTKRFEAVSEGLEDAAYMFALQKELDRLKGKIPAVKEKKLRGLLTTQLDRIMETASQEEVDAWHLAIGSGIDELSRIE